MEEGKLYRIDKDVWFYVYDYDIRFCRADRNGKYKKPYFMNINTYPKKPFDVLDQINRIT